MIRLAAAQPISITSDINQNADTLCHYLDLSKAKEVDLVVFPELFLCNCDIEALKSDLDSMSVSLDDPNIRKIQDSCEKNEISTIFGALLKHKQGLRNSAVIINSVGEIAGTYDKMNLWIEEKPFWRPGNKLQIFKIAGYNIGIAICYDSGFPEHIRSLALRGADIIACLNAFNHGEEEHRYHLYWPMRALENTVYIITSNLIGTAGSRSHFGKSAIFDPTGRLLVKAASNESIITAVAEKDRIAQVRREITYLKDLRWNLDLKTS